MLGILVSIQLAFASPWCQCGESTFECHPADSGALTLDPGCQVTFGNAPLEPLDAGIDVQVDANAPLQGSLVVARTHENGAIRTETSLIRDSKLVEPIGSIGFDRVGIVLSNRTGNPVRLDAVRILRQGPPVAPIVATEVEVHHRQVMRARRDAELWVPLPANLPGQQRNSVRLTVEPDDALGDAVYSKDGLGNFGVQIRFAKSGPVEVRWESNVLLTPAPAVAGDSPEGWSTSSDIVQSDASPFQSAAKRFAGETPEDQLKSALAWKQNRFDLGIEPNPRKVWKVDALTALALPEVACTGHATLGAAISRAAGLRTRLVAGVSVGSPLQTHFVNEVWLDTAWRRIEPQSTSTWYPWDALVVTRIVSPEDEMHGNNGIRRFAAQGVPWKSTDEPISGKLRARTGGGADCKHCTNKASIIRHHRGSVDVDSFD